MNILATLSAIGIAFTDAKCPNCQRRIMAIPGRVIIEARVVKSDAERSGRGRVVGCKRCSALVEILEHR